MRNEYVESLRPGFYILQGYATSFFVEKESDGTVHQLIPATGERDGILEPEGWNHNDSLHAAAIWPPRRVK